MNCSFTGTAVALLSNSRCASIRTISFAGCFYSPLQWNGPYGRIFECQEMLSPFSNCECVVVCVCVSVAGCCSYFCFHWVHNASIECTHRVQWVSGWRIYRTTVVKRSHGFFGSIWLIYPMNAKFIQVKLAPLIGSFSVCVCVFICINFVCNRRMIVIAQLRGLFFISIVFLHIRFLFFFAGLLLHFSYSCPIISCLSVFFQSTGYLSRVVKWMNK